MERRLKLPEGPFKAYLFDCDGTIVDSMPLHYVAWKTVLAKYGCKFEEDVFYSLGGMPVAEIIASLNVRDGLAMPVEEVAVRKAAMYYELLPTLQAVPEVLEHIHMTHGSIPFGCTVDVRHQPRGGRPGPGGRAGPTAGHRPVPRR